MYIDGTSFISATAIWADSGLTTYAATGWYSDGTTARYWNSSTGVLGAAVDCPDCEVDCSSTQIVVGSGTAVDITDVSPLSGGKKFVINFDTLQGLGAVVIRFLPGEVMNGIKAVYAGVTNKVATLQNFGRRAAANNVLWLGKYDATNCVSSDIANKSVTFDDYLYDGSVFNPLGGTETFQPQTADLGTTLTDPGECIMYFSKSNVSNSNVEVSIYALCLADDWSLSLECPTSLPSFSSSSGDGDLGVACGQNIDQTYYYIPFTGQPANSVAVYNWVFQDANASTPLGDGYYRISLSQSIRVSSGVVTELDDCTASSPSSRTVERCFDGTYWCMSSVPSSISNNNFVYSMEDDCLYRVVHADCTGHTPAPPPGNNITFRSQNEGTDTCVSACVFVRFVNSSNTNRTVSYTDCNGEAASLTVTNQFSSKVCLRSFDPSTLHPDLSYSVIDCDCANLYKYVASLCGDSTTSLVVAHTSQLTPGTLVTTYSSDPDISCKYLIEQTSTDPIDSYVRGVIANETCADQCITYKVTNATNVPYTATFTNCNNGLTQSIEVPAGSDSNPSAILICCVPDSLNLPCCPSGLSSEVFLCNCT